MDRPNSPSEWSEFYADRAAKLEAAQAREAKAAPKPKPPEMHPLLAPRGPFGSDIPVDVQMHFIDSHLHHEQAHAAVQAHRDAAARERERLAAPHPLVHGPLSHIPVPEQRPQQRPR